MNLALSAVLIFILLIPPITFYVSYTFGRFTKAGPKFSFLDGIVASAIFSLFIHAIGVLIIYKGLGITVRFDIFLKLFGGEIKDLENKISNETWTASLLGFAAYNFIVFALAILSGRGLRTYLVRRDIHWRFELLRLNNKWRYLFGGYDPEGNFEKKDFDVLLVDVVVDTNDGSIIYSGYLVGASYNGEELERIYLTDVVRRELKRSEIRDGILVHVNEPSEGLSIPSEVMAIPYSQMKNMNLNFIRLPDGVEEMPENAKLEVMD